MHLVSYSGGHSSALVAIEVTRRFGRDNVILVNHDISSRVENSDIKRFKNEVAGYLQIPITYASHPDFENNDQFDVCIKAKAFQTQAGHQFCTSRLKTEPFHSFLEKEFPDKNCIIYYGFDIEEQERIARRAGILGNMGYKTDFPLAFWKERTITSTREIGIEPPLSYGLWKHANCTGCLKAGKMHWYITFLTRKDLWEKAKLAEEIIGHAIIKKGEFLEDLEPDFKEFEKAGLCATEHENPKAFFNRAKKIIANFQMDFNDRIPCDCTGGINANKTGK